MSLNNNKEVLDRNFAEEEEVDGQDAGEENEVSEDEESEIQPGITKFTEGCRAFRIAFKKIMKKNISDDSLGTRSSLQRSLLKKKLNERSRGRQRRKDTWSTRHKILRKD